MPQKIVLTILLLSILAFTGCSASTPVPSDQTTSPASGETTTLKIGSLPRIFDLVLYAAQEDGVFQNNGLQVEIIPFRSVVERNTAFLTGELDGFVDSIYEVANLNKDGLNAKAVGHNLMPNMFEIVVSPGSGITTPAQLKGREIATSTGTIMEYALDKLLASENISPGEASYLNVPNMALRLEMMVQGKLPAAIFTPPLSVLAVDSGNRLLMDDTRQLLGGPGLIFSPEALKNKSSGVKKFVQSWQETVKIINAGPENYRSLLVTTAQVPEAIAETYPIPVFPEVRLPSQEEVDDLIQWMKSREMLTGDITYEDIVETGYLE